MHEEKQVIDEDDVHSGLPLRVVQSPFQSSANFHFHAHHEEMMTMMMTVMMMGCGDQQ